MQNQSENRAYAGFFVRWMAYVIDMTLISLIVWGVKLPFSLLASKGATILTKNVLFQFNIMDITGYIGVAMYFVLITYFAHTTIGKALFRLQVVCDKEWTFINILYRETIGRFLSSLMCIGYLAAAVTKKRQGFHDMLCDTYVVYKDMYVKPKNAVVAGAVSPMTTNAAADDSLGQSAMIDRSVSGGLYVAGENATEQLANDVPAKQPVTAKEAVVENVNVTPQPTTGGYRYYDVSNEASNHSSETD